MPSLLVAAGQGGPHGLGSGPPLGPVFNHNTVGLCLFKCCPPGKYGHVADKMWRLLVLTLLMLISPPFLLVFFLLLAALICVSLSVLIYRQESRGLYWSHSSGINFCGFFLPRSQHEFLAERFINKCLLPHSSAQASSASHHVSGAYQMLLSGFSSGPVWNEKSQQSSAPFSLELNTAVAPHFSAF